MIDQTTKLLSMAVVGAGIAGLSCAATLTAAGCNVTLFDKGRRPGGRMATRRAGGASFDHGAQYATARGEGLKALFASLLEQGAAASWEAVQRGDDIAWIGVPGMSAIPRSMAERLTEQGATLLTERHVSWLHENGSLRHQSANIARPGSTSDMEGDLATGFDAVLLALPAPQAAPLLATIDHPFAGQLGSVSIAPCWAIMATFAERVPGPDTQRLNTGPLSFIARGGSRPGAPAGPECWVMHASATWSRAHLEDDPASVTKALMDCFHAATGSAMIPLYTGVHRWRYALVETPLGTPFLWDPELRIGVCGDWCLGARVEAAYDSGVALAHAALSARI